jgi:hypothetical protein
MTSFGIEPATFRLQCGYLMSNLIEFNLDSNRRTEEHSLPCWLKRLSGGGNVEQRTRQTATSCRIRAHRHCTTQAFTGSLSQHAPREVHEQSNPHIGR